MAPKVSDGKKSGMLSRSTAICAYYYWVMVGVISFLWKYPYGVQMTGPV
jgi:hypothetical protein